MTQKERKCYKVQYGPRTHIRALKKKQKKKRRKKEKEWEDTRPNMVPNIEVQMEA